MELRNLPKNNKYVRRKNPWMPVLLMFFSMLCTACDMADEVPPPEKTTSGTKETGIHKTVTRGPVTVELDLDKKELTIADQLNLSLSVVFDEAWDVTLPPIGEKLDQFGIVSYHTDPPELTGDNRSRIRRAYVLEPFLSGEYKIPAMTVRFQKKNAPDEEFHEIETEAVTVLVQSLLPENFKEMALHDIKPPVDLPKSLALWFWAGGILGFLLISGIAGVFVFYRLRHGAGMDSSVPEIPPHEQAFAELRALVDEKLVEQGKIKEFYHRISDILRRYIENRFHLKAPEQTTEEFLAAIQSDSAFNKDEKALLKEFLTLCDLVKFATFQPETADIQKTFDSCKAFITGTQEKD
jgi:hypothetical protein